MTFLACVSLRNRDLNSFSSLCGMKVFEPWWTGETLFDSSARNVFFSFLIILRVGYIHSNHAVSETLSDSSSVANDPRTVVDLHREYREHYFSAQ